MGKYIGHRLVPRPELGNSIWTDSALPISIEIAIDGAEKMTKKSLKVHLETIR